MSIQSTVEIRAEHIRYYSQNDEAAFYEWLEKIRCVTSTGGTGYTLCINVQLDLVDQDALRELLALFHRYHISKSQLGELVRPELKSWFHDQYKFWNSETFLQVDRGE